MPARLRPQSERTDPWGVGPDPPRQPVEAALGALDLDAPRSARSDGKRRVFEELLAPAVEDAVVVVAQERANHAGDALGPVAEALAGQHRRQLDGTSAFVRRAVTPASQPN